MRGLVSVGSRRPHTVGAFFVTKKSGQLRLILDTRRCNVLWKDPPKTLLPTAGYVGRLEVEPGEKMYMCQTDVADAFYRIALPPGAGELFMLPPARTAHVASLISPAQREQMGETFSPCLRVLPKGWTWALS
eukprot:5658106-Heterocapsa_arctica.AAC.1